MRRKKVFTVGHSTRSIREFLSLLQAYGIQMVVDIRHFPGSKKFPHFGQKRLQNSLARKGIDYVHIVSLGGRRRPDKEITENLAWRNVNFRGYADHMRSKQFKEGLKSLISLAKEKLVVIMCAEAVPWRCHRSLVGDALLVNGFEVDDIFSETVVKPHKLTVFAKVYRKKISYPLPEDS